MKKKLTETINHKQDIKKWMLFSLKLIEKAFLFLHQTITSAA
jgi:hypothetical protein